MPLRSRFSVTIRSHFEIVDEEYIEELKGTSKDDNMKNSTVY